MRPAKTPAFTKETELCATFLKLVDEREWTAYAETAGWDILLVRKGDGFQIGIEAKLRLNVEVLTQAIEEYPWGSTLPGPDCRAVLVPADCTCGLQRICDFLGITIIRVYAPCVRGRFDPGRFHPTLPKINSEYHSGAWHEWAPAKRCPLPEYVPDVAAGSKSPIQLTPWKIGALKTQATMELRGFVTREDFKTARVDHRRWLARETGWLTADGSGTGRLVKGPRFPDFAKGHPIVYEKIKAEVAKSAYADGAQGGMLL